ncbi:MAG: methyltransferase domain-containing protein [Candidatus Nanosalina sp.]
MSYIYHLAGENLELAEAEIRGFLRSQKKEEKLSRTGRTVETEEEPGQLKRLALTHEVSRKICETGVNNLESLETDYRPEESFSVRVENLSKREIDSKSIEKLLGESLSSRKNSVDLEDPDTVVKAYVLEEKVLVGEVVQEINRGLFKNRRNQYRPFSSPVSLDPVLARVLVNLSGAEPGETVLDPFCGTGGILIEAGLCGCRVKGLDIKEEMRKGCRDNLEEYGIINHDIRQGEISEIDEIFDQRFDKVVTDLPYGKSSKQTEDAVESFLNFADGFDGDLVFVWNEDTIGDYRADFTVYIHGSLTRYIFVVESE